MGKKLANNGEEVQASKQTCKNHENKTLHSTIKVLRPKVYITNSSSFKQLVQELTGNYPSCSQPHQQLLHQYQKVDHPEVIEIDDQDGDQMPAAAAPATTISMDSSLISSFDQAFDQLEEINQANGLAMHTAAGNNDMNSTTTFDQYNYDHHHHECLGNQTTVDHWDWFAYQNLESWLLDGDDQLCDQPHSNFYNGFSSISNYDQNQQEVSVFDYELGGLIGGW